MENVETLVFNIDTIYVTFLIGYVIGLVLYMVHWAISSMFTAFALFTKVD